MTPWCFSEWQSLKYKYNYLNLTLKVCIQKYLNMETVNSRPSNMPQRIEMVSKEAKARLLKQTARNIVEQYLFRTMTEVVDGISEETRAPNRPNNDGVYNYATGFLKYGLLRRVSLMSTASADGHRALCH